MTKYNWLIYLALMIPHDKMIYINKAERMQVPHHNLLQMLSTLPHLCFSPPPPEKSSPSIHRLWGDPQAGKSRLPCRAQCTSQVNAGPFWRPWSCSARSLPCILPKGTTRQPHALPSDAWILQPELIFSQNFYPSVFFFMLSSLRRTKRKQESGERPW